MVKYDTYVDSQTPYVGEIPSHWKMVQNKRVMHKEKRICESYNGQNIISLTLNGAIVRDLGAGGKMPATFDGYQHVYPGELLMCLFDIDVTPRCVGRVNNEGLTSPAYSSFVLHDNANLGYYYYYYLMLDHTKELLHLAKNLRHSLTEEQIGQIKVPLPPIPEQEAIADYLDRETDRIDSIIAEAKDSIEEYKAWKSSIIYEAVTKGLDSNVEMKDSGVEWIGKIPIGWELIRLKYFISGYKAGPFGSSLITDRLNPSGNVLVYTPEHIAKKSVDLDKNLYLPDERIEEMQQFIVETGDIIFPIVGSLGRSMLITEEMPTGIINQRLAKFKLDTERLLMDYFLWLFSRSSFYSTYIDLYCRGSIIVNLTKQIVGNMPIPLPAIKEEQKRICEYLESKCSKVDFMIAEKESLIEDLEAYKKSLIFEVVTGKKKVC